MFHTKTPYEREWKDLQKKEDKFFKNRSVKKESMLNQKLSEKVPEKLQKTLDAAFAKAFSLIFQKGTSVIEKTYKKEKLEQEFQIDHYADEIKQTRKTLHKFSKKANSVGRTNIAISGVSGIGMGLLGVGIPDIPVFTALIMRSIYEIAMSFGYEYESEEEKRFILMIIEGAVSYGSNCYQINLMLDDYIETGVIPADYQIEEQIKKTAATLSKELLYMKFLQGIPVVGAVGGAFDVIYTKHITEYANIKYRRRFLRDKIKNKESKGRT